MLRNEESHLVAALMRGISSAWNVVYERHAGEIFAFVFHLVGGDRFVAEELCQEIWLRSIDRFDQFDPGRGTVRGWLFGVARKRVSLHFRQRASRETRFSTNRDDETIDASDTSMLPSETLEQIERADAVRAAMLMLAEDRRNVLISKYIEGLSVKQIAARTGKTVKAIETLLSRSRTQMRGLLRWYLATQRDQKHKEPSGGRTTKP